MDILSLSAAEIARRIKAGALSPVDAVEAHITRIEQVNPRINAVIIPMYEQARAQARTAAERIAQQGTDDLPPLFGVPMTIKDCWPVAGERFTGGSVYHRDDIASEDAPVVKRLKDAGAIILGKTNLPDMCWSGDTVNPIFGVTRNPHRLSHMAGGSSGGEGAIIAAGGSPLGLGSDIAGSVRIPAAACGCVSLKPTAGRIPNEGHRPAAPDSVAYWNNAGPMARRVEDLGMALGVLSRSPVRDYRQIELEGKRVSVFLNSFLFFMSRRIRETVTLAAGALRAAGMEVTRDDSLPLLQSTLYYFGNYKTSGLDHAFKTALGGGTPITLADEYRRLLRGEGRISHEVLSHTLIMDSMGTVLRWVGFGSPEGLKRNRERILNQMGDVILLPLLLTAATRAPWTYRTTITPPYSFGFNSLGFPAAVVPVEWTPNGLPLAVQIVGRPDEDETVLAVAAEIERVFGGWRMATAAG